MSCTSPDSSHLVVMQTELAAIAGRNSVCILGREGHSQPGAIRKLDLKGVAGGKVEETPGELRAT